MERIESSVGAGFPDVSAAGGGKQFLIETKVAKSGWLYFERFQIPFYMKRLKYTNGRGIYVIAADDDKLVVHHACDIVKAPKEPYKKWMRVKVEDIEHPLTVLEKPWSKAVMLQIAKILILAT